jgi:hypothetical protein
VSPLSKPEIVRRLGTSAAQLYPFRSDDLVADYYGEGEQDFSTAFSRHVGRPPGRYAREGSQHDTISP